MRLLSVALLALVAATGAASALPAGTDWPTFGFDAARHGVGPASTGITAANVGRLRRQVVHLDGTVDSAPIYLHDVKVGGRARDVFFVTTSYGKTEAIDADRGTLLWRYTPAACSRRPTATSATRPRTRATSSRSTRRAGGSSRSGTRSAPTATS